MWNIVPRTFPTANTFQQSSFLSLGTMNDLLPIQSRSQSRTFDGLNNNMNSMYTVDTNASQETTTTVIDQTMCPIKLTDKLLYETAAKVSKEERDALMITKEVPKLLL